VHNFPRVGDAALGQLDRNQAESRSGLNYTLTRGVTLQPIDPMTGTPRDGYSIWGKTR
jgi:hypothetical protein